MFRLYFCKLLCEVWKLEGITKSAFEKFYSYLCHDAKVYWKKFVCLTNMRSFLTRSYSGVMSWIISQIFKQPDVSKNQKQDVRLMQVNTFKQGSFSHMHSEWLNNILWYHLDSISIIVNNVHLHISVPFKATITTLAQQVLWKFVKKMLFFLINWANFYLEAISQSIKKISIVPKSLQKC